MRARSGHGRAVALPKRLRRHATRTVGTLVAVALVILAMTTWMQHPALAVYTKSTSNPTNTWGAATKFTTCTALMKADGATQLYALADSTSTAADSSGGGFNGTYQGTVTKRQAGPCPADGALGATFNGSTGYVSTSRLVTNPTVFTMEIWFKTTSTSGGGLMSFNDQPTGNPGKWDRQIYLSNTGTANFGVSCGNGGDCYASSTTTYRDGQWHLASGVLSSAGQKLYVDGTLVGTNANNTDTPGYNGYWRIGHAISDGPSQPTSNYINGTLAFAAYYPVALTQAQIQHHYATGN